MGRNYPWRQVRHWFRSAAWFWGPVVLLSLLFGPFGPVVTLLGVSLPILLWPYLGAALPRVDTSRGAIFATSCVFGALLTPALSMLLLISMDAAGRLGSGLASVGAGAIVLLSSLVVLFPTVVCTVTVPRSPSSEIPPGCFANSGHPPRPPIWLRLGVWLFLIACAVVSGALILLLALRGSAAA